MTLDLKLGSLTCIYGRQITVVLMTVKYIRQGQAFPGLTVHWSHF